MFSVFCVEDRENRKYDLNMVAAEHYLAALPQPPPRRGLLFIMQG